MEYGKRLQQAMDAHQPPRQRKEVAKALGISPQALGLVLRGTTKSLTAENNAAAADYLDVDPTWLATGEGGMGRSSKGNFIKEYAEPKLVPLLSQVQAGMYKEIIDRGDAEMIVTAAPLKRYTFALRVAGDSMLPTFPDGCIIYVDPEVESLPGDFVIAENDQHEGTFKKLVRMDNRLWLQPLNPQYRAEPLNGQIIGKVVGMHVLF
jgi:SOS-response transcriptional repressor LexA